MIPANEWLWFGEPGHLAVARKCLYHMHTHIGHYCVSTVGDYRPNQKSNDAETIGSRENDYTRRWCSVSKVMTMAGLVVLIRRAMLPVSKPTPGIWLLVV